MNKFTISLIVSVSMALMFYAGYRIGDSKGFKAGFEQGYSYDCRAEITVLASRYDSLARASEFAYKKITELTRENSRLRYDRMADSARVNGKNMETFDQAVKRSSDQVRATIRRAAELRQEHQRSLQK